MAVPASVVLPYALTYRESVQMHIHQRPATDNDMCIALHSNAQRQSLSAGEEFIAIK